MAAAGADLTANMPDLSIIDKSLTSLTATPGLLYVLKDLHTQALTEAPYLSTDSQPGSAALDKFVALDPDKCALVYLLLRATASRFVVEAGTSFGVSTIYLALAVGQNALLANKDGKVIATENEPTKAAKAREYWKTAGHEIEKWIELREGDIRETLKTDLPDTIDFVLLDIWSDLALPTMKLVQPRLRLGATIVVDNATVASEGYKELQSYFADPQNGFRSTVAPYSGGLQVVVYVGNQPGRAF